MKNLNDYFTREEKILWCSSVMVILVSFFLYDRENYMTLAASLIGVSSLILNAKGNPAGQVLMIVFSLLYGIISYSFAYYGEMLTYLGMSMPMAVFSLVTWLRHPYNGDKSQVRVNHIRKKEVLFMFAGSALVMLFFYFVLVHFHTANIVPSTISVTTSFLAVYLTFRRSPYFALGYAANDIVLIVLWILASAEDIRYLSVVICFAAFLINDIYGFLNWQKMKKTQSA